MNTKSFIFIFVILSSFNSQSQELDHLYFVNKNNRVDKLIFIDQNLKLFYPRQLGTEVPKLYLLNEHNLIVDTLKYKIRFQDLIIKSKEEIIFTGLNTNGVIMIHDQKFLYEELLVEKNQGDIWRGLNLNNQLVGTKSLKSSRNQLDFEIGKYEPISGNYTTLFKPTEVKINRKDQKKLNISYALIEDKLYIFNVPSQELYVFDTLNSTTKTFKLPNTDGIWYYYFDNVSKNNYFIVSNKIENRIYKFIDSKDLLLIGKSEYLPEAIVNNKLHVIKSLEDAEYHYLYPISMLDISKSNTVILDVVEVIR